MAHHGTILAKLWQSCGVCDYAMVNSWVIDQPGHGHVKILLIGKFDTSMAVLCVTSSTAQGGGGSFNIGNLKERLVAVNDGRQSAPTDGPTSGWRQCSVVAVVSVVARYL